ncbi:unnamed protein product [Boreogadus saida]
MSVQVLTYFIFCFCANYALCSPTVEPLLYCNTMLSRGPNMVATRSPSLFLVSLLIPQRTAFPPLPSLTHCLPPLGLLGF